MKQPNALRRIMEANRYRSRMEPDADDLACEKKIAEMQVAAPAARPSDAAGQGDAPVNGTALATLDNSACLPPHADPATVGRAIPAVAQSIVKVCSCCGAQYTHTQWLSLRLRGIQKSPGGSNLELRDCTHCVGTMAVEVFT